MPKIDIYPLAELFRANILKMLKKEGRIDDGLIEKIMKWKHNSGFSVHNGVRLSRDDDAGRESLAQYIMRNPFSVKKITYNSGTGTVIYKSRKTQRRSKGGRKNFQVFTATEFIGAITQHIPEKSFQLVRYYGWYSNRGRGEREKRKQAVCLPDIPTRVEILDVSDYRPKKIPSPQWRECIKKIWEVDPLSCPRCVSEMKIISFINETDVIRKILEHVGLLEDKTPLERAPPDLISEKSYEPYDDGRSLP